MLVLSLAPLLLFLAHASIAGADSVPADAFPGVQLDTPLEDRYETGDGIPPVGVVDDAAMADGQILFNFVPASSGAEVQVFLDLEGGRFRGYQIFGHDQAGGYDLQVFLGAAEASSLDFVGQFEGFEVDQGSGVIRLPTDFFRGIELEEPLATAFATGESIPLAGRVEEGAVNGHLLFRFAPASGGETVRLDVPLRGRTFSIPHLFFHDQAGAYQLEVFLGGEGASSLDFVGGFPVMVATGEGPIEIPRRYFSGIELDHALASTLLVGAAVNFAGTVEDHVQGFRLELESAAGLRIVRVGVDGGRFDLPLRLLAEEAGPVSLTVVVEQTDGQFVGSRSFPLLATTPESVPRLEIGVLAIALLPDGETAVPVSNTGGSELRIIDLVIDAPFTVLSSPEALQPGERREVVVDYAGGGEDDGLLTLISDDPITPRQTVSLRGLATQGSPVFLPRATADATGDLRVSVDLSTQDQVLVLYSARRTPDEVFGYEYTVGDGGAAAKSSEVGTDRMVAADSDRVEAMLRSRERKLAAALRSEPSRYSPKAVVADFEVGDSVEWVFPDMGAVTAQTVSATVVAINERAVAWLHDDLRASPDNVEAPQISEIIDGFAATDYGRTIDAFGAPSDVDGDGKVSFLFTHLVDDVGGIGGFYSASSVLPAAAGGDGNSADLMFISPTQRLTTYRSLLVHEFQHLINFNQHVLVRGGEGEVSWLNEGLSHVAEDLVSGHAESGVAELVRAFVLAPWAAGLHGEAQLNPHKRGAAYLFVRSLVDRMGEGVLLRLVGTGLADWDNVEAATGDEMSGLLATWGSQLMVSGLELFDHSRLNYRFGQLHTASGRGFPLPTERRYAVGGEVVSGILPPRGVDFVRVTGAAVATVGVQADPNGQVAAVVIPLPRDRTLAVWMPADYLPGLTFQELLPGRPVFGRNYTVSGDIEATGIGDLLFQFAGDDTLLFEPELAANGFSQELRFDAGGSYNLEAFSRPSTDDDWEFVGAFGPIRVVAEPQPTTVEGEVAQVVPTEFSLGQAFPNPFNGSSVIPVYAPEGGGAVELVVYNALGQRVRRLHRGLLPAGWNRLSWDGAGDDGTLVASGVYVYRLSLAEYAKTQSLLFLK